jgi:hypothetical protein
VIESLVSVLDCASYVPPSVTLTTLKAKVPPLRVCG